MIALSGAGNAGYHGHQIPREPSKAPMGRARCLLFLAFLLPVPVVGAQEPTAAGSVVVAEVVADPQSDWNGDGSVTASDEFVELHNAGPDAVSLVGWRLLLNDTTPTWWDLSGDLASGARLALVNPPGEINNNGHVALVDAVGRTVSEVRFGTWTGNAGTVPDANANSPQDEALRWLDDRWSKGHATPDAAPSGPFARHAPPFDFASGRWWDPGNRTRSLRIEWADADADYSAAGLRVTSAQGVAEAEAPIARTGGLWKAEWATTTPSLDFTYEFDLVQSDGRRRSVLGRSVSVDGEPPTVPSLVVPEWTSGANATYRVGLAADEGVGGVLYAVQTRSGSDATWIRAHDWSAEPPAGQVPMEGRPSTEIRSLARDAYGNLASGPARIVRRDDTPPAPVGAVDAQGYRNLTLGWQAPLDAGSGVDRIHVHRSADAGDRTWTLPANASALTDEGFRLGDALRYEFVVYDRAGNPSNATIVEPAYEGRRPHASGLRLNKPVWGTGELRIHADFDRPMDPAQHPTIVLLSGNETQTPTGRWLANRTTYVVEIDSVEGLPAGPARVRLEAAVDGRSATLWKPVERTLIIDADPPRLTFEAHDGWVNASGVRITAQDAVDAAPRVRARLANATEWREATASLVVPLRDGDRVVAYAIDQSGQRSGELSRTLHVDAFPPSVEIVGWQGDALRLKVTDNESGVLLEAVEVRDGPGRQPLPFSMEAGGVLRIPAAPPHVLIVRASDQVENQVRAEVTPPPRPAPAALPRAASKPESLPPRDVAVVEDAPPSTASTQASWPVSLPVFAVAAAAAAGVALGALAWARVRRRGPGPSLAARLRDLRAVAEGPARVEP